MQVLKCIKQKPAEQCSLQISAVKPGATMEGLVHCFGEAVSRKLKNILKCGSSVDGWPISGVLLGEPGTGNACQQVLEGWNKAALGRR